MVAAELAAYLHAEAIATWDASGQTGNVFVENLPDTPDVCVAIYQRGGAEADRHLPYDRLNLQVIVRGTQDPRTAQALTQSIYNVCYNFHQGYFLAGGTKVVECEAVSMPGFIGRDQNARVEYSLNFNVQIYNPNRRY